MARRDLEVRIRADVGAYKRAMSGAIKATDEFARAGLAMQRKGMQISQLGDTVTRRVTLPLLAVGAAATKMALDFDKSFVTMQTLAGLTASDVDALKESVLDLAGETGKSPRELAEALYFLRSSGLDGAAALDALEVSAKGSAAGLGPVVQVADAVSSAMLAYAKSGLTAAEATDVLVATAREGKVEPAELATQMGRLVPVASELGITFGDVGGAIAALSTKGNNAEQATTQLTQVMMKLLKPSRQAEELLDGVGLSADALRGMIAEKGLLGTLEELKARLGDAGFIKFLEDSRAVQGGLALLGGDLNKTREIMDAVGGSAGSTDAAFATWAKSMGAENARAFADFQVALIKMGEVIAPIASDVLSAVSSIAEAFGRLPGGVQKALIFVGLFAAAMGPLLSVGGRIVTTVGTMTRLLSNLALPAGTVAGAFNGASSSSGRFSRSLGTLGRAAAIAGGIAGLAGLVTMVEQFERAAGRARVDRLARDFLATSDAAVVVGENFDNGYESMLRFGKVLADVATQSESAARDLIDQAEAAGLSSDAADALRYNLDQQASASANVAEDAAAAAGAVDGEAEAMEGAAGATEDATSALQQYIDTLKGMFNPQFAMIDAMQGSAEAQQELRDATQELADARASGDVDAITEAEARYTEATNGARQSVVDLQSAANALKDSMEEGGLTADEVTAEFVALAQQQGFTAAEALVMAEAFGIATGEANTLGRTDPNVAISETGGSRTRGTLSRVQQAAINTGRQRPNVQVRATDRASGVLGFIRGRINQLPSSKTITIQAVYRESGLASSTLGRALARQHGGPAKAGQAYVVGETQPELFVPNTDGTIIPSVPPKGFGTPWEGGGAAGGGIGSVDVNLHITGNGVLAQQFMHGVRTGEIQLRVVGDKVKAR